MIVRSLIVLVILALWLALVADELNGCTTHSPQRPTVWPDATPTPDSGHGGFFGRPDADG